MQPFRETKDYARFLWAEARDPRLRAIAGAAFGLIAIGSCVYWVLEGWPVLDAVYFSVMTLTTVGYGDVAPVTALGKVFTIAYVLFGVGLFGAFLSLIAHRAAERIERRLPAVGEDGASGTSQQAQ